MDLRADSPDDKAELMTNIENSTNSVTQETAPLQTDDSESEHKGCIKTGKGFKMIIVWTLVFSVSVTAALILQIYLGPPQVPPHGAVSSSVGECSETGRNILQQGGSAVDAAIATMFCVGVVNAHSSGIGGGHFMMIHNHQSGAVDTIDARETAPINAHRDMFNDNPKDAELGGKAVAVPGELRGMQKAHKKYGRLPWKQLVKPAINIAQNGFKVTKEIANALSLHVKLAELSDNPYLAKHYVRGDRFVHEGETIVREDLAGTLNIIAMEGVNAFYNGPLAADIIEAVKRYNGILTMEDLANYKVIERPAVKTTFQDDDIYTMSPPSSGPALLAMFNIMEGYNLTAADLKTPLYYHRMIETFKFAYSMRTELGDPAFSPSVKNTSDYIMSKETATMLRKKIDDTKVNKDIKYYQTPVTPGTSHISVVDNDELFVSVTSTINYWFGSKLMTKSGILLNNEMADFSIPGQKSTLFEIPPSKINFVEPGKRPLSSMAPTIIHKAKYKCGPRLALGASNGTKLLTGIFEVAMNYMLGEQNLEKAIEKKRIHNQLYPDIVEYEENFPAEIISFLQGLGHKLQQTLEGINVVNGVAKVNYTIEAHADSRKFGKAAVY